MDNILPAKHESHQYVSEFKYFVKLASQYDIGLISLRNPSVRRLSNLQKVPLDILELIKSEEFMFLKVHNKDYSTM